VKHDTKPSLISPVLVLCLFAVCLPVAVPLPPSGLSQGECLTLADSPPAGPADVALMERCSAWHPEDAVLMGDLASTYEASGQPARAEAAYTRALTLDPDFADLRLRLGTLLLRRGAAAVAEAEATAAHRIQPNRQALLDLLQAAHEARRGAAR